MAIKPRDSSSEQQDPPPFMKLPTEIRLHIYELALADILTRIESFASCLEFVYEMKLGFRGALALLLASKAIRAEFSEGVILLVTTRCESFSARLEALKLEWKRRNCTETFDLR
jgi:hypothetical protein